MKRASSIPYLQVVPQNGTVPDFTPPCPPTVDPADWQAVCHGEDIFAGHYDWWVTHGGPFVADAMLKAQGRIPAEWTITSEIRRARSGGEPGSPTDSTVPASRATDAAQSVLTPVRAPQPDAT